MTLTPNIIAIVLYLALAGAYLVVIPLAIYAYLNQRWYAAGSIERFIAYFFVFMFFPGMILFAPFINLRPQKREIGA